MDKQQTLSQLEGFKYRLTTDVANAYAERGADFGRERFAAWRRQIYNFLDENLPGARAMLDERLNNGSFRIRRSSESDFDVFMRRNGKPSIAFIDSLCLDIQNDECDLSGEESSHQSAAQTEKAKIADPENSNCVFIVHGHDEGLKNRVARFVEKLGLKAVILHEQANQGYTIIEKIEAYAGVGFAIILYTPDDAGCTQADVESGVLKPRARQNVVFEHGYLIAKLSRSRVVPLVAGKVELPSDISGMVYVDHANWQLDIVKEMKAAGYSIDVNDIVNS